MITANGAVLSKPIVTYAKNNGTTETYSGSVPSLSDIKQLSR